MKKTMHFLLLFVFVGATANAQNRLEEMIKATRAATTDTGRLSAQLALGKYLYNSTSPDTMFAVFGNAAALAKEKGLQAQELEAMTWLGRAYGLPGKTRRFPGKGYRVTLQALQLARKYQSIAAEAELLAQLAAQADPAGDSAQLLTNQALQLAAQKQLTAQLVTALGVKAGMFTAAQPDSARQLLLRAISIARQAKLPEQELVQLVDLARLYSLNHWGDSAALLMQDAMRLTEKYQLVDQQVKLLREMIATEAGFFQKDSFLVYYERLRSISRQTGRDSLLIMSNFAQSATDIGDFAQALKTYLTLIHAYEEKKDSAGLEDVLYGTALCYEATRDYKKSIEYLHQARQFGQHNPFIYIFINVDLAKCFCEVQLPDSARYYATLAYRAATIFYKTEANMYGGVLNDLGTVYNTLGEDSLAINYLRRSYVYFTTKSIQYLNYCASTIGLAHYFDRKKMADSSMYYGRLCLATALNKGFLPFISEASTLMANHFQRIRNADSALYYQQIGFNAYKTMYSNESSRQFQNMSFSEQQRQQGITLAKKMAADQYASQLRLYALVTVIGVALLIGILVARNNRHRQRSYELLKQQKHEIDLQKARLENSLNELQATQSQLIQAEKMASLGELTAGIAHEIQNPLNFVNNFSEVNAELIEELEQEAEKGNLEEIKLIAKDILHNEQKINHHGKRADAIVKSMLQHSRTSGGQKEPTDINALAAEYLRLAYHGLRAKDKTFNASLQTDFDPTIGTVKLVPQDMGRVLLNIITNAFYAVAARAATNEPGYEPTVSVRTKKMAGKLLLSVEDNGSGIAPGIADKIFQPFFTTKPTGQGTGLGLSLAYDIVKAHGGELTAGTNKNGGASFVIQLPVV